MATGSSAGSKHYYDKDYVRVQVKIEPEVLKALKAMAIENDTSIVSIVQDASGWMLDNSKMIPADFPPISKNYFYTFIKKERHKSLKMIALNADRSLCELLGFMLGVWAKANGRT